MRFISFLSCFFLSSFLWAQTQEQLDHLDAYYTKSLKEWNVPGMAIAIVKSDSIVFAKGYGYADLEQNKPVDEHTLFAVASNSKALTATALAILVERGDLTWSDKVIDYLPYFASYDPWVTESYTIEDLLCHRGGLKTFSGDLLWYGSDLTPQEIIQASQYLEPEYDFRTHFGYSNINYLAAGMVLEAITDTSWSDFVKSHFLDPLGMNRTLTSTAQLSAMKNVATPYYLNGEMNHKVAWVNWDNIAPAGALISSVYDFSRWIQLNLKQGKWDGKSLFPSSQLEKLTRPHINHAISPFSMRYQPSKHFSGYGLGWELYDYHGYKVISHGGGYDGMISKSGLVPEADLGVVILTNSLNWLTGALMNKTLDVILGDQMEGTDWSAMFLEYKKEQDKVDAETLQKLENERGLKGEKLHDLSDYVGRYTDKMYGDVVIENRKGSLYFRMMRSDLFQAELSHWNLDIFTFQFDPNLSSLPIGKLWFITDKNGEIESLKIHVPNPDFFFDEFDFKKNDE
jgi:CubicO group peptidase (beta-lactamase class C family)